MSTLRLVVAICLTALVGFGFLAVESEAQAQNDRAASFEAVEAGAHTEQVPGGALLVAAYATVWILVLGYVVSLGFRQASTSRELGRLRDDLRRATKVQEQATTRDKPAPAEDDGDAD